MEPDPRAKDPGRVEDGATAKAAAAPGGADEGWAVRAVVAGRAEGAARAEAAARDAGWAAAEEGARRMRDTTIAVASENEDGLPGRVSGHFGRCPAFTLAEVRDGAVLSHRVVPNPYHGTGHVHGAVPRFLAELRADVVIAGAMGPRAVNEFAGLGIDVATGIGETVEGALAAWIGGARGITPCHHDHPHGCGGHHD